MSYNCFNMNGEESDLDEVKRLKEELESKTAQIDNLQHQLEVTIREFHEFRQSVKNNLCSNCQCNVSQGKAHRGTQTFETDFVHIDSSGSAADWLVSEDSKVTVAELVQEASKEALQSDYVYDESTNLYYSTSTGWYYDPTRQLFYDWNSQLYYTYDEATQSYQPYTSAEAISQKDVPKKTRHKEKKRTNKEGTKRSRKTAKRAKVKEGLDTSTDTTNEAGGEDVEAKADSASSIEEGEISSSEEPEESESDEPMSTDKEEELASEDNTPCLRLIVKESVCLQEGSLLLVSYMGASVGREKHRDLCIPDASVTKHHADITFNSEEQQYFINDLGSQNGTYINGMRLSEAKQASPAHQLSHGDELKIGLCKLLVHVHPGRETCDSCEPGLVQAEMLLAKGGKPATYHYQTPEEKEKERRILMKQIKKKFGLQGSDFEVHKAAAIAKKGYVDRAEERRATKGVDTLYAKNDEPASLDKALSSENKGFKMLQKMGWSEGQGLGKEAAGTKEPVPLTVRANKAGLGSSPSSVPPQLSVKERLKNEVWLKTQERFKVIESSKELVEK